MVGKEVFDLCVIGGGTAGLRTALYSASHGHKTAMIEPKILGGTCLNTGCIPTKTLLHSSHLFALNQNLEEFGIIGDTKIKFKRIIERVHEIINEGQSHINVSINNPNLTIIREKAAFVSKESVQAGARLVSAKKFIICTGSKSHVPPIKGIESTPHLISDDVINLETMPSSVAIIGGGYIGLEFATFFTEIGSKVTVIEFAPRLLNVLDEDIVYLFTELYTKKNLSLMPNTAVLELKPGKQKTVVIQEQETKKISEVKADIIIICTGRMPNTFGLGLDLAGVKLGPKGNIEVNNKLETTNPNIYAIGDVTGRTPFAHAAKRESHIALENALDNKKTEMNFDLVPWAMFTNPPIAAVGPNESQFKEKNIPYSVMKANFSRAGRSRVIGSQKGFVKLFHNPKSLKILGSTIIGPHADELIHEIVALMNANGTVNHLRDTIHIHPTLSEVFEALK